VSELRLGRRACSGHATAAAPKRRSREGGPGGRPVDRGPQRRDVSPKPRLN